MSQKEPNSPGDRRKSVFKNIIKAFQRRFKKSKVDDEGDNEHSGINDNSAQQQSADIFKLDIDCYEELFDYLPLTDLISIGQTCKRLNQVAGYIYQQNYFGAKVFYRNDKICIKFLHPADCFAKSINNIRIFKKVDFESFLKIQSNCHSLRKFEISQIDINASQVERMVDILRELEFLELDHAVRTKENLHKMLLDSCPKLKHFRIKSDARDSIIGSENDWLIHTYPSLEHLQLDLLHGFHVRELETFFELNPNVKKFSTCTQFFWANKDWMLNTNLQLIDMVISGIYHFNLNDFGAFCELFNQLYDNGFYQKLQFHYNSVKQELVDYLSSVRALVKFNVLFNDNIRLSSLKNLEELECERSHLIDDFDSMITDLNKLESIHFKISNANHILMLVSRAGQLKKIVVKHIVIMRENLNLNPQFEIYSENFFIDLRTLNKERNKLPNAQKVTIYVEEEVYLQTKWALTETNFDLVRLMRLEATEPPLLWD